MSLSLSGAMTLSLGSYGGSSISPTSGTVQQAYADGVWQRYFTPYLKTTTDELLLASVTGAGSTGDVHLTQLKGSELTTYMTAKSFQVDNHVVGMSLELPSGRIMQTFLKHNDTNGVSYRVSTGTSFPYTFAALKLIAVPATWNSSAYCQVFYMPDGTVRAFFRTLRTAGTVWGFFMATTTAASIEAGTEVWTTKEIYTRSGQRPYAVIRQHPTNLNRLDFHMDGANIGEGTTDIGHFYMDITSGSDKFYKTDGTEIVAALPFDLLANWTLIEAVTGSADFLHFDADHDAAGNPRSLVMYWPTGLAAPATDGQHKLYRWTGSAWTGFRVGTAGDNSTIGTAGNLNMPGGAFNPLDKSKLILSETVGGVYQCREYALNQVAGTTTLLQTISEQAAIHDFVPFGTGHASYPYAFVRLSQWTSYTNYNGSIQLFGADFNDGAKLIADWQIAETSGQSFADSSGNVLPLVNGTTAGVDAGDVTFVTNGISAAAAADGCTSAFHPDLIGKSFYFQAVVNTSNITGTGTHAMIARDDSAAGFHFQFRINNGNLELVYRDTAGSATVISGGAVTTGSATFHLFGAWIHNGTVRMRKDSAAAASGSVTNPTDGFATGGVQLASRISAGALTNNFPGTVAFARIWKNVTTEAQLAGLDSAMAALALSAKGITV